MAYAVLYVEVYAIVLVGAAIAALYLAAALPGLAGAAVFLTMGVVIIAAAPVAARQVFARLVEAIEGRHEATLSE